MELVKEIGAYAGIAAFVGLALLALLAFSQARDLRRLREWAGSAPDLPGDELARATAVASERAEEMQAEEQQRRREEAAREAERRAVEERERRRLERTGAAPPRRGLRDRLPEGRGLALAGLAVLLLGAGTAFVALQAVGDGEPANGGGQGGPTRPADVEVAVLNGTAVPGLAARVGDEVEAGGFELGAVTNSPASFARSVVMHPRGRGPEAERVARSIGIRRTALITSEIAGVAAGADVAVVVGEDQA